MPESSVTSTDCRRRARASHSGAFKCSEPATESRSNHRQQSLAWQLEAGLGRRALAHRGEAVPPCPPPSTRSPPRRRRGSRLPAGASRFTSSCAAAAMQHPPSESR